MPSIHSLNGHGHVHKNGRAKIHTRVSSSDSPLALPETPIYKLAAQFQNYLYLPDPLPLYVLMGAVATDMMLGHTIWLMFVGPPSCGGSTLLRSLWKVPRIIPASSISNTSAFLSGTKRKDRASDATGGMLNQIGDRGAIVFKDFTTILNLRGEHGNEIHDALREIYDGRWDRTIGGEGGRTLTWNGRIGVFAKSTMFIDSKSETQLGERFIQYRFPSNGGSGEALQSANNKTDSTVADTLQDLVVDFFNECGLSWESTEEQRKLSVGEKSRALALAELTVACRSHVSRDHYSRNHEIIDIPNTEYPSRVMNEISALFRGMERIGVNQAACWDAISKIALDSMPAIRFSAFSQIRRGVESTSEIGRNLYLSGEVAYRTLEDLLVQGVLTRSSGGLWHVSDWAEQRIQQAGLPEIEAT